MDMAYTRIYGYIRGDTYIYIRCLYTYKRLDIRICVYFRIRRGGEPHCLIISNQNEDLN